MKSLSILPVTLLFQFIGLFVVPGCAKEGANMISTIVTDSLSKSYLALGDSYTIGESVSSAERFPAQTVSLLKNHGAKVADPQYIAQTGWTTLDLQSAISKATLKSKYDIVSLLIGVNDQYQGSDTAGYRVHFTQLLQKAIQLADNQIKHVFVVSIPDYSVTPFGSGSERVKKEIDAFNNINRQVTASYQISYTNITPTSRMAANDQSFTANDGLHPSGKQYEQWALLLEAVILPVVK